MDTSTHVTPKYRLTVLLLLTLVYAFNFIDRQIIGTLSPFIKDDLNLTDWQLGLLKGIVFALIYTLVGIPIAWLADRYNRVKIMAFSLAVWSGFTALSGMATNFMTLALARLGVGIGEAGGSPPAHSIISDMYPKEKRTSALAIYSLGIPIGVMFAFFVAGQLVSAIGWRGTFLALGLPGVALAIVVLIFIKEPERGAMEAGGFANKEREPFSESIKNLLTIKSWWGMCMGIGFASFGAYSLAQWGVDYVFRHDPSYHPKNNPGNFQSLMLALGLINGIVYGLGTYIGALVAEKWAKKNVRAYALVPAICLSIGVPALILGFWVDSVNTYLCLLAIYLFMSGSYLGPSFSIAQTLAPISTRAMSTALFFLFLNIIGLGCGPTYVGFLSQFLMTDFGEAQALRIALSSLAIFFVISIFAFLYAAKHLPRDWAGAEERNEGT
ncbi:spinster family MFS transporter [Agarilytica rhodophyticola]|uniref:spinster family MFS transporter n=1 Tax=Agarilytica rhodophyticola TaxID=1737490 RepID=UPI000CD8E18B|nr:MFS transporter [Agarilytica rhodophyticola]